MAVSPFEERYTTPINRIFEEENKIRKWMEVELALAKTHAKMGRIPEDAPDKIREGMGKVSIERVKEIESEIHHDLMAVVKALSEQSGDAGKYVHLGATSYDIEDSATAILFLEAIESLENSLGGLSEVLEGLARKHKKTICVGRTHGQQAVPTTYGMKFALYYRELRRNIDRLKEAKKRIAVGKMSGAVGTMATFGEKGPEIQDSVMKELNIRPAKITNQVIQRDRHAEVISVLALTSALFEKIAREIRNLQRTEIGEIAEPFAKKQVGSSAMPHKRNPHKSERICSLAKLMRGYLHVAFENIALEHERDLTNSANERVVFGESFICVDFMAIQLKKILEGLVFFPENIKKNLEMSGGLFMAERVMMFLVNRGIPRQEAHETVRKYAQKAFSEKKDFRTLLVSEKVLSRKEAEGLFDYEGYAGMSEKLVEDALKD